VSGSEHASASGLFEYETRLATARSTDETQHFFLTLEKNAFDSDRLHEFNQSFIE
jgi:hypothetical protein